MSETPNRRAGREASGRPGSVLAGGWLGVRRMGRRVAGRGRWVRMILTAGLVVAGLSAWAIAVVQPWTGRAYDPGIVALPTTTLTPEQVRSLSEDVERLCARWHERKAPPLGRNPFASSEASATDGGTPAAAAPAAEDAAKSWASVSEDSTPADLLATVKTLRLEVTLTAPDGEPRAVINGQDYRAGDAVAGLEIVEIREGCVRLRQGTVTCLLRMH